MSNNAEIAKAFLSHNSHDKLAVEVIQGLLERSDPERSERPIPCWFDKDDLRSQGTWISQLEDAVATCGAAVVFYGPEGHGPVHKYEIDLLLKRAMYEQGRDAIRLVLVLLPGAKESEIQGFISLHMWADFRKGLDDTAALQRLRAFILGEAPKSGPGDDPKVPKPEIEPYRGLEPFEGKHAIYFFGRDNEIKKLCGHLQEWPFTAVIGGSGSGKSSIVRAGLQTELATKERPALAHTTTITVRPGSNPIRAMADQVASSLPYQSATERLKLVEDFDQQFRTGSDKLLNVLSSLYPRDDQHLLLVMDQFEELFTHSSDTRQAESSPPGSPTSDSQQTQFVELLAAVAKSQLDRLRIVITLRADFFDRCLSVPTLKSLIENRTLLLGKLSDDALRTVIEAPAFQVGAYFEKGLVARILKDVENQNGSLPLLQHALKELWEQRRFGFLTDDAYDETGGVEGALKKRANATLQNLTPDQREIAKNVFLRLTTLGEGVSDTRRRVRKTELYPDKTDPSVIDSVLKDLSSQANRLIVTNDDGTVEVTHEALIQRWDTLKGWLAENRDDKRLHDRLRDAANEWADPKHARDPSYLWEGGRLDLAENFDLTHPNMLTALEREFLAAGIAKREHAKSQKEEADREKLRQQEALTDMEAARARLAEDKEAESRVNAAKQRRLKQVGYVVAGVALVAAVIAGWQTWSASTARNAAQVQQASANRDNANFYWRVAVDARESKDPERLKAAHLFLRGAKSLAQIVPEQSTDADATSIRTDGLAAHAVDQTIIHTWIHDNAVVGAEFSRDESHVLTWSVDGAARLWHATKPGLIQTFKHGGHINGAQFRHKKAGILTWGDDKTARLWDLTKPKAIQTFKHDDAVDGIQLSRDESQLLTWSGNQTLLWDVTKPRPIQTLRHDKRVVGAKFNREESQVLTWSSDHTARLWDITTSKQIQAFHHSKSVNGALFNRDESQVLTWSSDMTARLWDVTRPEAIRIFEHKAAVNGGLFHPNDGRVLTWGDDKTVLLWDVTKPDPIQTFKHDGPVSGALFNQGASRLLSWSQDQTLLWDVTNPDPIQSFKHNNSVIGAQFSSDESRVLTWSGKAGVRKGDARLWDVAKPEPVQTFDHAQVVWGARFSRDESQVLTWSGDYSSYLGTSEGQTRLWEVTESGAIQTFTHDAAVDDLELSRNESDSPTWSAEGGTSSAVTGARFSVDGSRILTCGDDKTVRLWDVTSHGPIGIFKHDEAVYDASFSDNESRLLTWGDRRAWLWDLNTHETIRTFKHDSIVSGAQLSRDGSRLLTWGGISSFGGAEGESRLCEVAKPDPIWTFKDNKNRVEGAHLCRDASRVLTWGNDDTARLWDVTKPEPIQSFKHDDHVNGAQFNRDESHILTWSDDKTVRLWDVNNTTHPRTFMHEGAVSGAQFSRDEMSLLTWSGQESVFWEVTKSEPIRTFKHNLLVIGAQFSWDESRVLTWCSDFNGIVAEATLWDVTTFTPIQKFKHDGSVNGAQFSRDSSRVLTWSNDRTAGLWDVTKPEPIQSVKHDDWINGAQFNRDESRVLTWGDDGAARLWDISDPLEMHTPAERILELEVRSGTTLDDAQNLRTLKFKEWQDLATSEKYRAIEKKLPARSTKPAPQAQATNRQPTIETPGSSSKR